MTWEKGWFKWFICFNPFRDVSSVLLTTGPSSLALFGCSGVQTDCGEVRRPLWLWHQNEVSLQFPVSCQYPSSVWDGICVCVVRGYYPKGGGEVVVTVNPVKELQPVTMTERGTITKIYGRAFVAGVLPSKVNFLFDTHIHRKWCFQTAVYSDINWFYFSSLSDTLWRRSRNGSVMVDSSIDYQDTTEDVSYLHQTILTQSAI